MPIKVEDFKDCCEEADEEHNHIEDTEGQKSGGKRDKLCVLIEIVRWVVGFWARIHCTVRSAISILWIGVIMFGLKNRLTL